MAALNIGVSGGWRVSSTSNVATQTFNALVTCSQWNEQQVVLLPTTSEYVISFANLSAPGVILMTATQIARVNFAGWTSNLSAASASVIQFKDLFCIVASGAALPSGIHVGNSASDSNTITVLIGQ